MENYLNKMIIDSSILIERTRLDGVDNVRNDPHPVCNGGWLFYCSVAVMIRQANVPAKLIQHTSSLSFFRSLTINVRPPPVPCSSFVNRPSRLVSCAHRLFIGHLSLPPSFPHSFTPSLAPPPPSPYFPLLPPPLPLPHSLPPPLPPFLLTPSLRSSIPPPSLRPYILSCSPIVHLFVV